MRIENPILDNSQAFDIRKITDAAKKLYTHERFENRIPLLISRQDTDEEESDEESNESDTK